MLLLVLADSCAMLFCGVQALRLRVGQLDGYPAAMYFAFGSIALVGAVGDLQLLRLKVIPAKTRMTRHLWRLSVALFIASASFFLGQQKTFPAALRGLPVWYVPPLLVLGSMLFWLIRLRRTGSRAARLPIRAAKEA